MADAHDPGALSAPVIVTGAQQGIGLAIAEAFARAGRAVVIGDLHEQQDGATLGARWGGARVFTAVCDIADVTSIEALLDRVEREFAEPADTLVNNAAVQTWGDFLDADTDEFARTIGVNLVGTMAMTQRFARRRVAAGGGGTVVNLGSGCNRIAFPKLASYVASRGGIETFTKSAAMELGPHRIRVNCIAPGAIETARTQDETEGYAERWSPLTPLRRIGTPEDVADAVVALCQPAMRFVTGQTLGVDGGLFSRAVWPEGY